MLIYFINQIQKFHFYINKKLVIFPTIDYIRTFKVIKYSPIHSDTPVLFEVFLM
jgi:hypothetical protein